MSATSLEDRGFRLMGADSTAPWLGLGLAALGVVAMVLRGRVGERLERVHLSEHPITKISSASQKSRPFYKPEGFWYDLGGEWKASGMAGDSISYPVQIDPRRVLVIDSDRELDNFRRLYEVVGDEFETVDWSKVARDYDGIEIRRPAELHAVSKNDPSSQPTWLATWDVSSGCIWNPRSVRLR